MEIKSLFLFFGIAAAVFAVVVTIVGLRSEKFPDRKTMFALLGLGLLLVVGTGYFGVELQIEEAEEKKEKKEKIIGEEASVAPPVIPGVS
jgi:putative Mn2+ efflux pump MntP